MQINNMYPTPFGHFVLNDVDEMNIGLNELLYSLRANDINGSDQYSMAGPTGYHTEVDLLKIDNEHVIKLHKETSSQFIEFYNSTTGEDLTSKDVSMTGWGMIYGAGDFAKIHLHPSADIVLAYYTKVPDNLNVDIKGNTLQGTMYTLDPRPCARWDYSSGNSADICIEPKVGHGIIFPGWVEHYVTPHSVPEDRICISINLKIG